MRTPHRAAVAPMRLSSKAGAGSVERTGSWSGRRYEGAGWERIDG